jgi:hypothetical protein
MATLPLLWQRCHYFLDRANWKAVEMIVLPEKKNWQRFCRCRYPVLGDPRRMLEYAQPTCDSAWLNMFA